MSSDNITFWKPGEQLPSTPLYDEVQSDEELSQENQIFDNIPTPSPPIKKQRLSNNVMSLKVTYEFNDI